MRKATIVLLACVLGAVALHIRLVPDTHPLGDNATTSIYTWRAAKGDLTTGAYSRMGWNHPGPLIYQMLAPGYALSGYREVAIKWTALAWNLACVGGLLFLVRRAPPLAMGLAAAVLLLAVQEQRLLFWAWNPVIALLPFALLLVTAARVAAGEARLIPLAAAVSSFLIQAHLGYLPVVGLVLAATAALSWYWQRSEEHRRVAFRPRPYVATMAVLGIVWATPLWGEIRNRPGNLVSVASYVTGRHEANLSWMKALEMFSYQFMAPFSRGQDLITDGEPGFVPRRTIALTVAMLGLLAFVAYRGFRRGDRMTASLASICVVVSIGALPIIRAIDGGIEAHLIAWISVVAAVVVAVLAAEGLKSWRDDRLPVSPVPFVFVYLAGLATLGAVNLHQKQVADSEADIGHFLAAASIQYGNSHRVRNPTLHFSQDAWPIAAGVVLEYLKDHRPLAIDDGWLLMFGRSFKRGGAEDADLYLMLETETVLPSGTARHEWIATYGGYRLVRLFGASK